MRNAIRALGFAVKDIERPGEMAACDRLVFPGVGNFGSVMEGLVARGFVGPLKAFIAAGKPFLGICVGLQTLFEGSEESPGVEGLGVLRGTVRRFDLSRLSVPHIGWNGVRPVRGCALLAGCAAEKFYFDHAYYGAPAAAEREHVFLETDYGIPFASGVRTGNLAAVQFHPEKSGKAGLRMLENFLRAGSLDGPAADASGRPTRLAKRIIACLDVRSDDAGRLVVTKGDQYDVREAGKVRDLGDPVEVARRYYEEGADEIAFLNIVAFREQPLSDQPMLDVLRRVSERVFVPLTIGGGVRAYRDSAGKDYGALEVASEYFRSGADKVSVGSDAVAAAGEYLRTGTKTGGSSIEQISRVYGAQAVVISVDPRRVPVASGAEARHHTVRLRSGETCWYQCTVRGGREGRDLDAWTFCRACEELGAGEILLNSIDADGRNTGFDLDLIRDVAGGVSIPVIASSGAGKVAHFSEVFRETDVEAALAAGIFHRREVTIGQVKEHLKRAGIETR